MGCVGGFDAAGCIGVTPTKERRLFNRYQPIAVIVLWLALAAVLAVCVFGRT